MASLVAALAERGVPRSQIRQEAFGPASAALALSGDTPPRRVRFARSKLDAEWTPGCGTLLDLALANQMPATYSCRIGECHACIQRLLEGEAAHSDQCGTTLEPGRVLLCQAHPISDITIDL